ncbi:MAG: DEAD/DEAH box helicase domain-containing protein [Spirochaetes bacterium]|nr:MAG: DEAD/DEAH box helicase domain-containing protein [Spirochaetota bacterium]
MVRVCKVYSMFRKTATDFAPDFLAWLAAKGELSWVRRLDSRVPLFAEIPAEIHPSLRKALELRGIRALYTHQAQSYALARQGRNFVVVTPTASGKTLCYNLPVIQTLLENPEARALYLFPTKALSQDQQAELNEVSLAGELGLKVQTYDGDTPSSLRAVARTLGRIVITNPDMLHSGILPNHAKWVQFFSGLKYVVVDELHSYRGVFGSHVGNVIRRLKRIAAFYGSAPRFIFSSATIGNPDELAMAMVEEDVTLIDSSGAGAGNKIVAFYNPPLEDPVRGMRRSAELESQDIALKLLGLGVKTILFARSRLQVELVSAYMNESLANFYNDNRGIAVRPYRSGLLPSERRAIEKGLREGTVHGVVSTNALELGIDIGGLDAAVIAGYPGSMASFWQQAGRAGRRSGASIAIFVATSSPLDQYFSRHPEYFLSQSPEKARIDLDNPYIFVDHAKCAAFELPFLDGERLGRDEADQTSDALELLEEGGAVRHTQGKWHWSDEGYPSEKISLRSAGADNVVIIDATAGSSKVIGEMDRPSAKELIFDKAVYIHLGIQYQVKKLDIEARICKVEKSSLEYWTDAVVKTDLKVLTEDAQGSVSVARGELFRWSLGDVLVRSQAEKYNENVGYGEISLPPEEMQTRALSLLFPPGSPSGDFLSAMDPSRAASALSGAATVIRSLCPIFVLCDQRDIGVSERVRDPHFQIPAIYLFDRYPGGTGLAEALSDKLGPLMGAASEILSSCGCASGCPSCVGVEGRKGLVAKFLSVLAGQ